MSLLPNSTTLTELTRVFREIESILNGIKSQIISRPKGSPERAGSSVNPSSHSDTSKPNAASVSYAEVASIAMSVALENVVGLETRLTSMVFQRELASGVSASLPADGTGAFNLDMARTTGLLVLSTNYPAWVRVYSTDAARTADAARAFTVRPTSGTGVILDALTTSAKLSIPLSPVPLFVNTDSPTVPIAYIAITNRDTVPRSITLTITHLPQEK